MGKKDFSNWSKKLNFPQNVDILGYTYEQKTIFKTDLKKTSFSSKCWYFWTYGQKSAFPNFFSREKYLFLEFWYFGRYGQKTIFQRQMTNGPILSNWGKIFFT